MKKLSISRRKFIKTSAAAATMGVAIPKASYASDLTQCTSTEFTKWKATGSYPFKLGSLNCAVISDGTLANTLSSFGPIPDVDENIKVSLLEPHFIRKEPIIGYENALYIESSTAKILIDTGTNGSFGVQNGKLSSNLHAAGINPSDIDIILISHAHPDHINGLLNLDGSLAFPKAEVFIGIEELNFWKAPSPDLSKTRVPTEWRPNLIANAQKVFSALGKKLKTFKNNESPVTGITARHAPGHTPGHYIFEITSSGEQLFFTADLCNHHILLLEKPEWTFAFDIDPALAIESKIKFMDQFSSNKSRLLAYHFPFPGLWNVAKTKTGYRWVAESWNWL